MVPLKYVGNVTENKRTKLQYGVQYNLKDHLPTWGLEKTWIQASPLWN